jgi:hypothetical protein
MVRNKKALVTLNFARAFLLNHILRAYSQKSLFQIKRENIDFYIDNHKFPFRVRVKNG